MKSDGEGVEGQWVEDNPANKWERYKELGCWESDPPNYDQ